MATQPLTLGTDWVRFDEPCMGLFELNFQSPGNKGFHRYQIILPVREEGRIYEYRKDMGPAKRFKGVDQLRVPGGVRLPNGKLMVAHKVGELIDIADQLRDKKSLFDKRELAKTNNIREA